MRSPVANYHVSYETHSGKRKNPLSLQNHSSSQTQRILSSASKFTSCSGLLGFDRCLSSQLSFLCAVCPKQDPILHPRFVLFLGRLPHISKLRGGRDADVQSVHCWSNTKPYVSGDTVCLSKKVLLFEFPSDQTPKEAS